ncbi:MAG: hypothetical protein G3M78_08430 [Candidatus Nitrohelix vancouverensis]|uniref:Lipoprotein n=1 Tax=Candidatus Nitrohelix vancouverensis TaxID=2705534 RepID=A0A7T0C2L9_9BACT|nr:MAG: hypothetical protein G3M78_08430 [Candidatus Nitrohelix vancouverensis]
MVRPYIQVVLLAFLVFVTACAGHSTLGKGLKSEVKPFKEAVPFSEIPMISSFDFDPDASFIYESGSGSVKVGRLFYSGWGNLEDTVKFFENEMVNKGWSLVNSIRQNGVILNYQNDAQVATLIITHDWGKSFIEIQIGPK